MIPRVLLAASIFAGLAYPAVQTLPLPGWALVMAKGVCVGLLALYAATQARDRDGWLLVAVMALGTLGDVLLVFDQTAGGEAFAAGHVVATFLYLMNQPSLPISKRRQLVGVAIMMSILVSVRYLDGDRGLTPVVIYSYFLMVMVGTAWCSRFPLALTGLGACLFGVSDVLLVSRIAEHLQFEAAGWAVWLTYYLGQLLIVLGVTRTLARQ